MLVEVASASNRGLQFGAGASQHSPADPNFSDRQVQDRIKKPGGRVLGHSPFGFGVPGLGG